MTTTHIAPEAPARTVNLVHSTDASRTETVRVEKIGAAHIVARMGEADVRFSTKTGLRVGGHHERGTGYADWMIPAAALAELTGAPVTTSKMLPTASPEQAAEAALNAPSPFAADAAPTMTKAHRASLMKKFSKLGVEALEEFVMDGSAAEQYIARLELKARRASSSSPLTPATAEVTDADVEAAKAAIRTVAAHEPAVDQNAVETLAPPAAEGCRACHVAQMIEADDAIGGEFIGAEGRAQQEEQVRAAGPHTCIPTTDPETGLAVPADFNPEGSDDEQVRALRYETPAAPAAAPVQPPAAEPAATSFNTVTGMLAVAEGHIARVQDTDARLALAALVDVMRMLAAGIPDPTRALGPDFTPPRRTRAERRAARASKAPAATEGSAPLAPVAGLTPRQMGKAQTCGERHAARSKGVVTLAEVMAWSTVQKWRTTDEKRALMAAVALDVHNRAHGAAPAEPPVAAPGAPAAAPAAPKAPRAPKAPAAKPVTVGAVVAIREDRREEYVDVLSASQMVDLKVLGLSGKHAKVRSSNGVTFPKLIIADLTVTG